MIKKLKTEELGRLSTEEFKQAEKIPIICVLDNVRSALNVGSVFRTADAFALKELWLIGITAKPPNKEIRKTAIGATESVKWRYFATNEDAIHEAKKARFKIVPIEQTNQSKLIQNVQIDRNEAYALILGNEVKGVSDDWLENAEFCIEIPQFGTKHSLNVSVCAGIALWEFRKALDLS